MGGLDQRGCIIDSRSTKHCYLVDYSNYNTIVLLDLPLAPDPFKSGILMDANK